MSIIFLDVDGVVVHHPLLKNGAGLGRVWRIFNRIDPLCMNRLKRIQDATGAHFVVSSVIRSYDDDMAGLEKAFWKAGMDPREVIVGTTPVIQQKRHLEVSAWLAEHPEVTSYLCLDDDRVEGHPNVWVREGMFQGGLLDEHVDQAISILQCSGGRSPVSP